MSWWRRSGKAFLGKWHWCGNLQQKEELIKLRGQSRQTFLKSTCQARPMVGSVAWYTELNWKRG